MLNNTGNLLLHTTLLLVNSKAPGGDKGRLQTKYIPTPPPGNNSVCYGELGCFSRDYPWSNNESRPIAYLPKRPEEIDPKFCLYTRQDVKNCQFLDYRDPQTIYRSHLIPTNRVFFISHGFLENGFKPWMKLMMRRLLLKFDANVVCVDWGGGSSPPYTAAVANIRVVGAVAAHLIATLHREVGVKPEYVHMIGHSLGAHLSGYAGSLLQTKFGIKIGRITGLDPAEPHFSLTDPVVRLDETDAIFVDIIHTDAGRFIEGGLGIVEPIGHLDFYPNGGSDQLGCKRDISSMINEEDGSFIKGVRKYISCDHQRSYVYFIESLANPCKFYSVECDTYEDFLAGQCFDCQTETRSGGVCAPMGFYSIEAVQRLTNNASEYPVHVTLYTKTHNSKPFCTSLYRVTIIISNSTESVIHKGEVGEFKISIDGVMGKTKDMELFSDRWYHPGTVHQGVVAGSQVGRVRSAKLYFVHNYSWNVLTWRLTDPVLHLDKVRVDNLEEESSMELCLHNVDKITSGVPEKLRPCGKTELLDFDSNN